MQLAVSSKQVSSKQHTAQFVILVFKRSEQKRQLALKLPTAYLYFSYCNCLLPTITATLKFTCTTKHTGHC